MNHFIPRSDDAVRREPSLGGRSTSGGNAVRAYSRTMTMVSYKRFVSHVLSSGSSEGLIALANDDRQRRDRLDETVLKHVEQTDDSQAVEALLSELRGTTAPDRLDELENELTEARIRSERLKAIFEDSAEPGHVRAAILRAWIHSSETPAPVIAGLADHEARVREVAADEASAWTRNTGVIMALRKVRDYDPSKIIRDIASDTLDAALNESS